MHSAFYLAPGLPAVPGCWGSLRAGLLPWGGCAGATPGQHQVQQASSPRGFCHLCWSLRGSCGPRALPGARGWRLAAGSGRSLHALEEGGLAEASVALSGSWLVQSDSLHLSGQ